MAVKQCFSFATDLAANYVCCRFRITQGHVYKDPAVVELLRTKYADKMEEAVSRDRAKSVDNLKRTA